MKTQDEAQTALLEQRRDAQTLPRAWAGDSGTWPSRADRRDDEAAAARAQAVTGAEPCPERIWWFGVLVGGPLMLIGSLLMLTLVGAPLGIPLWAAGLGLMLSRHPCRDR